MQWDAEEPERRAKERDRSVAHYARHELGVQSPYYRARFSEARVDLRRIRGLADLARVEPTPWEAVASEPAEFIFRPTQTDLVRHADRRVVLSVAVGRLLRRVERVNREVVEPRYAPVLWYVVDGVPFGATSSDLDLLAEAGSRMLAVAGLTRRDFLVNLTASGPSLGHWQTVLGARRAGVAALHAGPHASADDVVTTHPTALAGTGRALVRVIEDAVEHAGEGALADLRTVVVVGEDPDGETRDRLIAGAARASSHPEPAVVAAWAPRGARALWIECPDGPGYHTYPDLEILEVERDGRIDATGDGEILWSALGWRGTVTFRLATGETAEVSDEECTGCGRRGPIVIRDSKWIGGALAVLDDEESVAAFQLELRRVNGAEELFVFLTLDKGTDVEAFLGDLDADLAATQYVVLPKRSLDARLRRAGRRVIDTREADLAAAAGTPEGADGA